MIFELMLPSLIAGLFIALSSGSLGCFVIWRRMAFFSDTLAHSAILGTALALIAEIQVIYGLIGFGILVALTMAKFDNGRRHVSSDTLLAIIAQSSLALGMLLLPLTGTQVNIEALLFGDILAISWQDVFITAAITTVIVILLAFNWSDLLALCIDEDLAATEGIATKRLKLLLFLLLVALVAIAVQMLGVLLISSLLLIPAAAARRLSHTPTQMLCIAPVLGMIAVICGLALAYFLNLAAGPAVVVTSTMIWLLCLIKKSD
ncbi:MAG: metal ABC transporter permease [Pseudomonadales bacterium]|nr:metal ABC transporter permease [Pseudomonadales bacterium]